MAHPYPPHLPDFSYVGKYNYSLNFTTFEGKQFFTDRAAVDLVRSQILRAGGEQAMELTAYCFMPDHVHLIVRGTTDTSDCLKFIARAKQYSGFAFKRDMRQRLWARYGYERVIREDIERAMNIRYLLRNPIEAGLVRRVSEYPFVGSGRYSVSELCEIAELPPDER